MSLRLDISAFDDTELGAEVRSAYASGRRMVTLVDSSEPDDRAMTWVDGTHGLYKMRCAQGHVWLTALGGPVDVRIPRQHDCTVCHLPGEWVHD